MPKYAFICEKCETPYEYTLSFKEIDNFEALCEVCEHKLTRDYASEFGSHAICVKRDVLQPLYVRKNDGDWKKEKAAKVDCAIMDEPFESQSELDACKAAAEEEEKNRGKHANAILGGNKAAVTKAERALIRERDLKKKKEQQRMRRKSGV